LRRCAEHGTEVPVLGEARVDAGPRAAAPGVRAHDLARLQSAEERIGPPAVQPGEVASGARAELDERGPVTREQTLEHAVPAEEVVLPRQVVDVVREPVVPVEEGPVGGLHVGGGHALRVTR
jgi:hypothetical protein